MELHRLKPMKEGYPEDLFNKLYKETEKLRKSLVHGIDHRRFGVSKDIVLSWFDDKFIFVFNKHFQDHDPDRLKGDIIKSLQTFKYRVLRGAYTKQAEFFTSTIELEGETKVINYISDSSEDKSYDMFLSDVMDYFERNLSDDAFILLGLQLNPPPYILDKLNKSNSQIPLDLILDFFELDSNHQNVKYIRALRKEIQLITIKAREDLNPNSGSQL